MSARAFAASNHDKSVLNIQARAWISAGMCSFAASILHRPVQAECQSARCAQALHGLVQLTSMRGATHMTPACKAHQLMAAVTVILLMEDCCGPLHGPIHIVSAHGMDCWMTPSGVHQPVPVMAVAATVQT